MDPLQLRCPFVAEPHWHEPEKTERAIDQTPPERNPAQGPETEGVGNDEGARDHAESEKPAVAHGITQRTDESQINDEMPERQPIGSVKQESEILLRLSEGGVNSGKPWRDFAESRRTGPCREPFRQQRDFCI